jgi:hypothetical protein
MLQSFCYKEPCRPYITQASLYMQWRIVSHIFCFCGETPQTPYAARAGLYMQWRISKQCFVCLFCGETPQTPYAARASLYFWPLESRVLKSVMSPTITWYLSWCYHVLNIILDSFTFLHSNSQFILLLMYSMCQPSYLLYFYPLCSLCILYIIKPYTAIAFIVCSFPLNTFSSVVRFARP